MLYCLSVRVNIFFHHRCGWHGDATSFPCGLVFSLEALHCCVSDCTVAYSTTMYSTVDFCIALCCAVLCCILYCTVLAGTVLQGSSGHTLKGRTWDRKQIRSKKYGGKEKYRSATSTLFIFLHELRIPTIFSSNATGGRKTEKLHRSRRTSPRSSS